MDTDKLWTIATRIRTLVRALNNRRGLSRKDDRPPDDHWKQRIPEVEAKLLDEYYKFKGWNKDGITTKERLCELGLDFVAEELIARGILKDGEGAKEAMATNKAKD